MSYLESLLGIEIQGVLYNILSKPPKTTRQRQEESEEEFQIRFEAAAAKNKSGKTNVQRTLGETDTEFYERLVKWYYEPGRFIRQEVLISDTMKDQMRIELWNAYKLVQWCRKTDTWARNRNTCFQYNTQCSYWDVCNASPTDEESCALVTLETMRPHSELPDSLILDLVEIMKSQKTKGKKKITDKNTTDTTASTG